MLLNCVEALSEEGVSKQEVFVLAGCAQAELVDSGVEGESSGADFRKGGAVLEAVEVDSDGD